MYAPWAFVNHRRDARVRVRLENNRQTHNPVLRIDRTKRSSSRDFFAIGNGPEGRGCEIYGLVFYFILFLRDGDESFTMLADDSCASSES